MITNAFAHLLDAKSKRDKHPYTYAQVAAATGLGLFTIWRWYVGDNHTYSAKAIEALCLWLECDIGELLLLK